MTRIALRLDHAGIAEVLHGAEVRKMVDDAATSMAAHVRGSLPPRAALEVKVYSYTTDRAAAAVVVRGPNAMVYQARDGVLTRAAKAIGAEVTAR